MSKKDGVAYYYIGGETEEFLSGVAKMDLTHEHVENLDPIVQRNIRHSDLYSDTKPKGHEPVEEPVPDATNPIPEVVEESTDAPEGGE